MMEFIDFLEEKNHLPDDKKILVSDRFQKEEEPVFWKIRGITEAEYRSRKQREKDPWVALCLASIVYPNLEDPLLWESYGVADATSLLKEMLYPGEYLYLLEEVKLQNGFDVRRKAYKEAAKNA